MSYNPIWSDRMIEIVTHNFSIFIKLFLAQARERVPIIDDRQQRFAQEICESIVSDPDVAEAHIKVLKHSFPTTPEAYSGSLPTEVEMQIVVNGFESVSAAHLTHILMNPRVVQDLQILGFDTMSDYWIELLERKSMIIEVQTEATETHDANNPVFQMAGYVTSPVAIKS